MTENKKWYALLGLVWMLALGSPVQGNASAVLSFADDSITATWDCAVHQNSIGILAVYAEPGVLLQCAYQPLETNTLCLELSANTLAYADAYCKAMLWDAQTLSPLCNATVSTLFLLRDTPYPVSFVSLPGEMVLRFQNVGAGLQVNGLRANGTFMLCGADGKFYDAQARVTAFDTVTVYARSSEPPVGVRYQPDLHPTAGALTSVYLTPVQAFSYQMPETP